MSQLTVYPDHNSQTPTLHTPTLQTTDAHEIAHALTPHGVRFERWRAATPVTPAMTPEEVIAAYDADIARLKAEGGYVVVDAVSMWPDHPQREALRAKFLSEHTHSEDEVRFFVSGQGLFCLHLGDQVYQVLCCEGDLISVPAGTRHWFDMGSAPRFTALRLFCDPAGWVATFTGDDLAARFPTLP